jgi:hypothetical protein
MDTGEVAAKSEIDLKNLQSSSADRWKSAGPKKVGRIKHVCSNSIFLGLSTSYAVPGKSVASDTTHNANPSRMRQEKPIYLIFFNIENQGIA